MEFLPEHSRLFGYIDARGWGEASSRTRIPTHYHPRGRMAAVVGQGGGMKRACKLLLGSL